jgi:hypothetical protein
MGGCGPNQYDIALYLACMVDHEVQLDVAFNLR